MCIINFLLLLGTLLLQLCGFSKTFVSTLIEKFNRSSKSFSEFCPIEKEKDWCCMILNVVLFTEMTLFLIFALWNEENIEENPIFTFLLIVLCRNLNKKKKKAIRNYRIKGDWWVSIDEKQRRKRGPIIFFCGPLELFVVYHILYWFR